MEQYLQPFEKLCVQMSDFSECYQFIKTKIVSRLWMAHKSTISNKFNEDIVECIVYTNMLFINMFPYCALFE